MDDVMRVGFVKSVFAISLSLVLAGCNSAGQSSGGTETLQLSENQSAEEKPVDNSQNLRAFCPKTVIRAGTETFRTFAEGVQKTDPGAMNSLLFQYTITEAVRECNYSPTSLNMRVGVKGRVINGPTGQTGTVNVPIRVAVTTVTKEVLYSQLHQVPVTIPEGRSNALFSFVDSGILLPVPERPNIIVYVGFDEGPLDGEQPVAQTQ